MKIEAHIYLHNDASDEILSLLRQLTKQGETVMADLTALQAQVERTTQIEESAITLITGLADQLRAAATDPAAVQALADELSAKADSLSAAITANTTAP